MQKIIKWILNYKSYLTREPLILGSYDAKQLEALIREQFPGLNEVRDMLHKLRHATDAESGANPTAVRLTIWDDGEAHLVISFNPPRQRILVKVKRDEDLAEAFKDFVDERLAKPTWQNDMQMLKDYFDQQSEAGPQWRLVNRLEATLEKMSAELALAKRQLTNPTERLEVQQGGD